MNLWRNAEHQLAGIWFLGLFACFLTYLQIVINSLFKCRTQFTNGFTMKAYDITNACDMANKAAIIPIFTISFPAGLSIKRAATAPMNSGNQDNGCLEFSVP